MKRMQVPLLILLAAVVLQATVVPYLAIKWFRPDLPLLVVIYIGIRRGSFRGVIVGFAAGLLVDTLSVGFFGLTAMCYSVAGFIVGKLFYSDVPLPLHRWLTASAAGIFAGNILFAYFFSLYSEPGIIHLLYSQVLPATVYTWALGAVWAVSPFSERRRKLKV